VNARAWSAAVTALLIAPALLLAAPACSGSESDKAGGVSDGKPLTLTLAAYAQPDPDEFVAAVHRLSKGSIRIDTRVLWRDGQPDYEEATIRDVRRGAVDLAVVSARAFDLVGVGSFQGLLAPFLVDNLALQRQVLESPIAKRMVARAEDAGVVGLGLLPGPLRRPVAIRTLHGYVRPDVYRGAVFGVRPSQLSEKTLRTLGARPAGVVLPRDFGAISGMEYDLTGLDFSHYDEQATSIAGNVVLWPRPVVVIASPKRFGRLEPQVRALLLRAAAAARAPAFERVQGNESSAARAVCARGRVDVVSATRAELAGLVAAVGPVYEQLRKDPFTARVIADIESLRRNRTPAAIRCPSESARNGVRRAPVDGTWRWAVTPEELLAAGQTPAGADRQKGRWQLVLDGGRFDLRNLDSRDAIQGTYRVEGNRLIARAPGDRAEQRYRWSLYRRQLRLTPVKGFAYGPMVVAKPLARVG
jgi:TRAP-type C4-dicarboxylate transport system substrate-binding protein